PLAPSLRSRPLSRAHSTRSHLACRPLFFLTDTATPEIYTLSLHDALPISRSRLPPLLRGFREGRSRSLPVIRYAAPQHRYRLPKDRKSTRLNSSHVKISYAVFCLKKKKRE